MSYAKHTPEPWFSDEDSVIRKLETGRIYHNPIKVATGWIESAWPGSDGDDESKANARRIVACVNACKGIATEDIEAAEVVHIGTTPPRVLGELEGELLEALKTLHSRLSECVQLGLTAHEAYDSFYQEVVGAAIAKATGAPQ